MTRPRFFLAGVAAPGTSLVLSGPEAHHAHHVLRLVPGRHVLVFDGAGAEALCEVRALRPRALTLLVLERRQLPPPACELTLLQALTRQGGMETILEKATELGVHRVVPLLTHRTVPQLQAAEAERKRQRWERVTLEAMKQCGAAWRPQVAPPRPLAAALAEGTSFELQLLASLEPDARHPRLCFEAFLQTRGRLPRTIGIWVGPEGDFTPPERGAIRAGGAHPVTLGPRVLRSDTAATCALALAVYELEAPRAAPVISGPATVGTPATPAGS